MQLVAGLLFSGGLHRRPVDTIQFNTYHYSLRAVLHIDPVVLVVPECLNTKVLVPVQRVVLSSSRLNKKALCHFSLTGQYQNPAVDPQPIKTVRERCLCFCYTSCFLFTPFPLFFLDSFFLFLGHSFLKL